ncbi:hypothetical protein K474DRAFT_1680629 [Panus rudis PR-1116 ss-1]|nr:hypothetical protein K474DRAFT_1680629 [Panus rudis PR-1116 ss-1]
MSENGVREVLSQLVPAESKSRDESNDKSDSEELEDEFGGSDGESLETKSIILLENEDTRVKHESCVSMWKYNVFREIGESEIVKTIRRYDSSGHRHYQNLFSGNWTWEQADLIAQVGKCNGAMFTPVILGSDKTTVSIATGQNDYYPLYISLGNVHNNVRRAHRNAVALLAFLAIPKCEKEYKDDADYRRFRRQLFHSSLATILRSLRPAMTTPEIARCPDGHFRRIIYGLAPYIADYPEQALVACIVQKWCPICIDHRTKLGGKDPPSGFRSRQHTEELLWGGFSAKALWDDYGIVSDAIPFTNDFPRADIHELIAGDLLHQMIKGTFKDHLVTWVGEYITLSNSDTPGRADEVMSEIDRRIAAVPTFPGLRHFYQGRDFKQWTGDDSKGLMKVYLPALVGLIPDEMVQAIASFLEFCYLARRDYHTEATLADMEKHLQDYLHCRDIFIRTGVRPEGFDALPREHALKHYVSLIRKFGSLNGLCTSITESKHIKAIKEPWRRTSHFEELGQMLLINQHLDKLAAARADFAARGMLDGSLLQYVLGELERSRFRTDSHDITDSSSGMADEDDDDDSSEEDNDHDWVPGQAEAIDAEVCTSEDNGDARPVEGPHVVASVTLARTPEPLVDRAYPHTLDQIGEVVEIPNLADLVVDYLSTQDWSSLPNATSSSSLIPSLDEIQHRVCVMRSATAVFYAPSDPSGRQGMKSERIRATPRWRGGPGRNGLPGFRGLLVARVRLFFSFKIRSQTHECALVQWFSQHGNDPDDVTGMWVVTSDFEEDGTRSCQVISVEAIVRAAHLIPVYGEEFLSPNFHHSESLHSFRAYYVNKFADHHAYEIAF